MPVLYLVRHGPTHERTMVGHRDVPVDLSDTAQIARVSAALPRNGLVVSSDLQRAALTASALEDGRDRLPHDPDLREFDFGQWDGMPFADVARDWPDLSRRYWEAPGDIAPPDGESWNAAAARVSGAVDRLMRAHPRRPLIIVAHFGAILTQVQRAAGVTAYLTLAHRIDNFSITELQHSPRWGVARINHLP
ncbi:MAG: histidine phosphatase family protein [Pseudomonadota bacterium]